MVQRMQVQHAGGVGGETANAATPGAAGNAGDVSPPTAATGGPASGSNIPPTAPGVAPPQPGPRAERAARRDVRPPDVQAELNDDDQLEDLCKPGGVMLSYLPAVHARLQYETNGKASIFDKPWLVPTFLC